MPEDACALCLPQSGLVFGSHEGVDAQRRTRSTGDAEDAVEYEDEDAAAVGSQGAGRQQAAHAHR